MIGVQVGESLRQTAEYVFDHRQADNHYLDRKDVEEGLKHVTGLMAYGATGIIDGAIEGAIYLATEVLEDFTYLLARSARRSVDGLKRGWNG